MHDPNQNTYKMVQLDKCKPDSDLHSPSHS